MLLLKRSWDINNIRHVSYKGTSKIHFWYKGENLIFGSLLYFRTLPILKKKKAYSGVGTLMKATSGQVVRSSALKMVPINLFIWQMMLYRKSLLITENTKLEIKWVILILTSFWFKKNKKVFKSKYCLK